jgi:hypothetical protein
VISNWECDYIIDGDIKQPMLPNLHELKSNNIKSELYYNFNIVNTFTLNNIIIKMTIFIFLNLQPYNSLIFDCYLMH